nr:hypothetical protein HQ396_16825 [Aeromonas hydrophila]
MKRWSLNIPAMVFFGSREYQAPAGCSIKKVLDADAPPLKLTNFPSNTNN